MLHENPQAGACMQCNGGCAGDLLGHIPALVHGLQEQDMQGMWVVWREDML